MTWDEFIQKAKTKGVEDTDEISWIDFSEDADQFRRNLPDGEVSEDNPVSLAIW